MKILHTGDLHLDSPFASLDQRRAEIRKNELRAAFTSMMTYARMNEVDIALFAGDLFDNHYISRETIALMDRELQKFAKPVFITPGNHDCADDKSVWRKHTFPENVHVFTQEELSSVRLPELGATVWGYGFTTPAMYECPILGHRAADSAYPDDIQILLCHADTQDTKSRCAPLTEKQLALFGADYAALGHIHNPPAAGEKYAYCGCLEPRDFTENGPRGACIVDITKTNGVSSVKIKRIRFSKRRYESASIDLTGCAVMEDVKERIADFLVQKKFGDDTLLRLRCTGTLAEGLVLSPDILGDMGLFLLKIEDATLPDSAQLAADTGIRGAFYRKLVPALHDSDPRKRETALRALRYGLAAIDGENITD